MSLPPHKAEITALVQLLEQDWASSEELARAAIKALDAARAERITYVAVMQFGAEDGRLFYQAIGPYTTVTAATRAVTKFPGATLAHRVAVVPLRNDDGVTAILKEAG